MERMISNDRQIDPAVFAAALSVLLEHTPPAAREGALAKARPYVDERDWTRLMAAIAPLPL